MDKNALKDGYGIQKDLPWEPSNESLGILTGIFQRFKKHKIKEGDVYFLYEIALEALWDGKYGEKLDRKLKKCAKEADHV